MQETADKSNCLRALLQYLLRQGAFLVVFPVPVRREKGFPVQLSGAMRPHGRKLP